MKGFTVELPGELLEILGSEEQARREVKIAVVLDLVRRERISRAKAAELLELKLWDLPALLAQYRIPWFDYRPDELERDLAALRATDPTIA
jgi:predicted HTH domain antitoxin